MNTGSDGKRTYRITTLGCKVNQYESNYISKTLEMNGLRKAGGAERADICVINTCIVTQRASRQSRQAIRKLIRENPGSTVAAAGCYAQVFPDELKKIDGLKIIAGNTSKGELPRLLLDDPPPEGRVLLLEDFEKDMPFEFLEPVDFPERTRAYLKIQDGCRSFCSYCIVPFARGPLRSLPPAGVLDMMKRLAEAGYREVVLTGIHLGKYGVDLGEDLDLSGLLKMIAGENMPVRVRISSIEPNEVGDELIEMMAGEQWLCRHFHISLQNGDDRILKRMKRGYDSRDFARLVEKIKRKIPLAAIGIDIMSGFPGEDHIAHTNTVRLLEKLPVSYLHVFPFSPRPGTRAFSFEGRVLPEIIKERAMELRMLGEKKRGTFYGKCLEREFVVLAERRHPRMNRFMSGRSDNYLAVNFVSSDDLSGELIGVRLKEVQKDGIRGEMSSKGAGVRCRSELLR